MALPFATNAAAFLLGAVLISRMSKSVGDVAAARSGTRPHFIADLLEGVRWLAGHAAMRTLAITIFTFNITFGAAWSVLVLYATQRLGMGAIGFGLLTTVSAIGGLVVGSGVGGVLAQNWGITAPFWFAFVGSAVFVVLIWRQLRHIAHADEQQTAGPPPVASAP
jgi:predicted MFS family arabinose efflux permease